MSIFPSSFLSMPSTSLSCSLFHYFTYFSHETTELCRYVLNTFKSISYHLTVQAIYFHIFHSYSYWINGFKETFEDQDGYLYIKRSILIARKMTVSFGLVAKNPLLIQALQSFSCVFFPFFTVLRELDGH